MTLLDFLRRLKNNQDYPLEKFRGVYRGFSPTDESPIVVGELEVVITEDEMKLRHATGCRIDELRIPTSIFKPMTRLELCSVYINPLGKYVNESVGFSVDGMKYLFLPNASDDEFGLIIMGNEMADILGPTLLYSPKQIQRGVYQMAVELINSEFNYDYPNGCFPTLVAGGKLPK